MQIKHRIGIKAMPEVIYTALTTDEGLAGWWTSNTSGAGDIGSIIDFRFGDISVLMQVIDLTANQLVVWECVGSPAKAWIGTEIEFELHSDEKQTFINFCHRKWPEEGDFFAHCSLKWGVFMLSLKDLLETGQGSPAPNDIQIDHN